MSEGEQARYRQAASRRLAMMVGTGNVEIPASRPPAARSASELRPGELRYVRREPGTRTQSLTRPRGVCFHRHSFPLIAGVLPLDDSPRLAPEGGTHASRHGLTRFERAFPAGLGGWIRTTGPRLPGPVRYRYATPSCALPRGVGPRGVALERPAGSHREQVLTIRFERTLDRLSTCCLCHWATSARVLAGSRAHPAPEKRPFFTARRPARAQLPCPGRGSRRTPACHRQQ
jgi:hypothetical protein